MNEAGGSRGNLGSTSASGGNQSGKATMATKIKETNQQRGGWNNQDSGCNQGMGTEIRGKVLEKVFIEEERDCSKSSTSKVYGYLTNTKVKFIVVTTDLDVRDADVSNFFRSFHAAYVDAVSNPFHVPGKEITSSIFAERVSTIVKSFGLSSAG